MEARCWHLNITSQVPTMIVVRIMVRLSSGSITNEHRLDGLDYKCLFLPVLEAVSPKVCVITAGLLLSVLVQLQRWQLSYCVLTVLEE